MQTRRSFNPVPMGAGTSYVVKGNHISGFLPTVDGTLSVTGFDSSGLNVVTLVNAVPVTAGIYVEIPLQFPTGAGGTVALTTAAGTLFI